MTTRYPSPVIDRDVSIYEFGAIGDGVHDDTEAVQKFFDFVVSHPCRKGSFFGVFAVSKTIIVEGIHRSIDYNGVERDFDTETLIFESNAKFLAAQDREGNSPKTIIEFRNMGRTIFKGIIIVSGYVEGEVRTSNMLKPGVFKSAYSSARTQHERRQTDYGIRIVHSGRAKFDCLRVTDCRFFGIDVSAKRPKNNVLLNLGSVSISSCGVSAFVRDTTTQRFWHTAQWENPEPGPNKSTLIVVNSLPPIGERPEVLVEINEEFFIVREIDDTNSTLLVRPPLDNTIPRGELKYYYGGGVRISGDNTAFINLDQVELRGCGIGLSDWGQYGSIVKRIQSDLCGITLVSTGLSTTINGLYSEKDESIALLDPNPGHNNGPNIISTIGVTPKRIRSLANSRSVPGNKEQPHTDLMGSNILTEGRLLQAHKPWPNHHIESFSKLSVGKWGKERQRLLGEHYTFYRDNWKIVLPPQQVGVDQDFLNELRVLGYDSIRFTFLGSGPNFAPTANRHGFEFFCNNENWIVDGIDGKKTFKPPTGCRFAGPVEILVHYRFDEKDELGRHRILVSKVAGDIVPIT